VPAAPSSIDARWEERTGPGPDTSGGRAFARMSVQAGQREVFLAPCADDAVWFGPAPSNAKEDLRRVPAAAGRTPRTLDWEPVTGEVALSGDVGYTTGPYAVIDHAAGEARVAEGWFFTIWK
jgi:hypothetical protein